MSYMLIYSHWMGLLLVKALEVNTYLFLKTKTGLGYWEWLNAIFNHLILIHFKKKLIVFEKHISLGAILNLYGRLWGLKRELPMSRFVACQLAH